MTIVMVGKILSVGISVRIIRKIVHKASRAKKSKIKKTAK